MNERVCHACGRPLPIPESRLICSACNLPIRRGQGGWKHGGDGRPKHKDCTSAREPLPQTMPLIPEQA